MHQFSSVQSLSRVRLLATPWITACQASLSITSSQSLPKLTSIELVMPSSHLILCHPPSPPAPNPSQHQGLFQWVNSLHQVAKVLEFQLQYQSFQWTPRTALLYGLVGSPCSPRDSQESSPIPQFKSINSLVLSLIYGPTSHPYMTTGKTIALTRWIFVSKVMSLLFNMLSFFQGACVF